MNEPIQLRTMIPPLLLPLLLACFGLLPQVQAQTNTAYGNGALVSLTSGVWNSGFGFEALNHDTAGKDNTATGVRALFSDTSGSYDTANGVYALYSNTTGFFNTAAGAFALANNISGNYNTANGYGALYRNTADYNTANGFGALYKNTTGSFNTATGYDALFSNTGGARNTATGFDALLNNTGAFNTAIGAHALQSNTTGNSNIALGFSAGSNLTTGSNNIDIGNDGNAPDSATIRIGAGPMTTFIAGICGVTTGVADAIPVLIDSNGQLGTLISSRRFKKEIKAMEQASEAILALKPVTFHYKSDASGTPQFGLIAEEVAEVNPDLVVRDANGEIYTVRYDAVNAMLLNEFLKEHRTVEEQKATITQLQKGMETITARLKEQESQIQKVSARLGVQKPAPRTVLNGQ